MVISDHKPFEVNLLEKRRMVFIQIKKKYIGTILGRFTRIQRITRTMPVRQMLKHGSQEERRENSKY